MRSAALRYFVIPGVLLATVPAAHLLPGLDGSDVEQRIRDAFHVIGFAAVAWVLFEVGPSGAVKRALFSFAGALAIGFAAELSQRYAGNVFNPDDIARDALGAGLIVIARLLWIRDSDGPSRAVLRGFAVVAAAAVLAPLTYWGWAWFSERLKAPMVMDFESRFVDLYYNATNAEVRLAGSNRSDGRFAEIMLSRAPRSGIRISTALYDWRRWQWLVFDAGIAAGPDAVVSIHLNDYDSIGHYVDTQTGMVTVSAGMASYRVSISDILREAGRADDAGNIRQVAIFARSRNRGTVLHVDNLRLE